MIGILPAAGNATRIHGLPKFLLPVGDTYLLQWHIQHMEQVTDNVCVGCNEGNEYLLQKHIDDCLYVAKQHRTMSETVLSAHYQMQAWNTENLLFGMPDTYFDDEQVYSKLATSINGDCDVAVAMFRARHRHHTKAGMVRTKYGKVIEVVDKPETTDMVWLWGALAWKPAFWEHIRGEDPHIGYALPRAIAAGLDVRSVRMDGNFWDCGTSAEYYELIRHLEGEKVAE